MGLEGVLAREWDFELVSSLLEDELVGRLVVELDLVMEDVLAWKLA